MSIIRVGTQNQIDLSWNKPTDNGSVIKNYFFYQENRINAPLPPTISYYSYALPVPFSGVFVSSTGVSDGIVINSSSITNSLTINPKISTLNYFDMSCNSEIELSWQYNPDRPIQDICSNSVSQTIMTITLYKTDSSGNNRIDLLRNFSKKYDSYTNMLGPIPQNNDTVLTDIFPVTFDAGITRELMFLHKTDNIQGIISFSDNYPPNLTYTPATASSLALDGTVKYSIIVKSVRIAPYRLPITRRFTSLSMGSGNPTIGFSLNKNNALMDASGNGGILYYMPQLTTPMKTYEEAKFSFTWSYTLDLSNVSIGDLSGISVPFQLRIRGYSRPFFKPSSLSTTINYNTTSVSDFVSYSTNPAMNMNTLFDITQSYVADNSGNNSIITRTFDISGMSFPLQTTNNDTSHTQIVYVCSIYVANNNTHPLSVRLLSQTITPFQIYCFSGPDPTLPSSTSNPLTTTIYDIIDPYKNIKPFFRFYNLTNGVYYAYKIAPNNIAGTTQFSSLYAGRCGSVPNRIYGDNYIVESSNLKNKISIFWQQPAFSGYEIQRYNIQMVIDINGKWMNILDYTPDLSANDISFNTFIDTIVPVTNNTIMSYRKDITSYTYKDVSMAMQYTQLTSIPTDISGVLINGNKYYIRVAGVNELGVGEYSPIYSGVPISIPQNAPIQIIGTPVVGTQVLYITWEIPKDDGGAPILNYLIEYAEISSTNPPPLNRSGITYMKYYQKINNIYESDNDRRSDFLTIYNNYKTAKTPAELEAIEISRSLVTSFVVPPIPITLYNIDKNNSLDPSANKYIYLSSTHLSDTYISDYLNQNVFDLSNIELKWYYFQDPSGTINTWSINDSVSFNFTITGYLNHIHSNTPFQIFSIPTKNYTVTNDKISTTSGYKYIDPSSGLITVNGRSNNIFIPTLPRIDFNNYNSKYQLYIDFSMSNIVSTGGGNPPFIIYIAPLILNGTAPLRTNSSIKTRYLLKVENNDKSPIYNNRTYRFRITPFNISDYFADPSFNNIFDINTSTESSASISNCRYSLVSDGSGGKVVLTWNYSTQSDYFIKVSIPDFYSKDGVLNEYPNRQIDGLDRSIEIYQLRPNNGIVTYSMPSDIPDDIANNIVQRRLTNGRAYTIEIAPVKIVEINNIRTPLPAPFVSPTAPDSYIYPFTAPLRPVYLKARGNNSSVTLTSALPDITQDPNYYITTAISNYYNYRFYVIEYVDIDQPGSNIWISLPPLSIPSNSTAGDITSYTLSGLVNSHNYKFRISLAIRNDDVSQNSFSSYTYMSYINNDSVAESSGNMIYPSQYPYKPSDIQYFRADRTQNVKQMSIEFMTPSYNGNAETYTYNVFFSTDSGITWFNIFDISNGIANSSNNTPLTSLATTNLFVYFIINCKNTVANYTVRMQATGKIGSLIQTPTVTAISNYSSNSTIIL